MLALCNIAVILTGCNQDALQRCQELFDAQKYEQALDACEGRFSQHQDSHALLNAASAAGEKLDDTGTFSQVNYYLYRGARVRTGTGGNAWWRTTSF